MRGATSMMPADFSCENAARSESESFSSIVYDGRRVFVATFPVETTSGTVYLIVMQRSFLHRGAHVADPDLCRGDAVRLWAGDRWGWGLSHLLSSEELGRVAAAGDRECPRGASAHCRRGKDSSAIERQIGLLFKEIEAARGRTETPDVKWSPQSLHDLLAVTLPDAQIIIVSNREPYIHKEGRRHRAADPGERTGLGAGARDARMRRHLDRTWQRHAPTGETVDAKDRIAVPPRTPSYTLRRVWVSEEEQDGYYYGLANEGLWPLCHIAFVRPMFREERLERTTARSTSALPTRSSRRPRRQTPSCWCRIITSPCARA